MHDLSHHESHVLALVGKWQPTTAYFVRKIMERGLASTFSSSPGSVYPAIERLKKRGLVKAVPVVEDGRKTDLLECTDDGVAATLNWIRTIAPADLLPEDPWRTRMAFVDAMPTSERLSWLFEMRDESTRQATSLSSRMEQSIDDGLGWAVENAKMLTEARLAWVERLIARMVDPR